MIVCCCRAARAIKKIANKRCMLQENRKRLYVANQRHNYWDKQKENASREISFSISGIIIKTHLSFWAVLKSSSNSLENTRLRKNNKFILIPTLKWLPAKDKKNRMNFFICLCQCGKQFLLNWKIGSQQKASINYEIGQIFLIEREKNKCAESIKGKQMGISRSLSSSSFAAIIYSLRAETQLQASAVRTNCRHSSNNWRKKQAKRHWHFAASFSAEDRAGDCKAGRNRNSSLSVHRKIEKSVMATGKASAQKGTANVRKQSQQKQKPSSVETYKTNVPQCANRKKC